MPSRQAEDGLITVRIIDPNTSDLWVLDHCPSYSIATLPFTAMASLMQEAARSLFPNLKVVGLEEIQVTKWLPFLEGPQEVQIKSSVKSKSERGAVVHCQLNRYRQAPKKEFTRMEPFCHGTILLGDSFPETSAGPKNAIEGFCNRTLGRNFYEQEKLFSEGTFQIIEEVVSPEPGKAFSLLKTRPPGEVPEQWWPAFLLDASTQTIAEMGFNISSSPELNNPVGAAHKIVNAEFFGEYPGKEKVLCEVSYIGQAGHERFPEFEISIFDGDNTEAKLWVRFHFLVILFPMGRLFEVTKGRRKKFIKNHQYLKGVTMAHLNGSQESTLSVEEVKQSDWLPDSVAQTYLASPEEWKEYQNKLPQEARHWLTILVAAKDMVAQQIKTHPSKIQIVMSENNQLNAQPIGETDRIFKLNWSKSDKVIRVFFNPEI